MFAALLSAQLFQSVPNDQPVVPPHIVAVEETQPLVWTAPSPKPRPVRRAARSTHRSVVFPSVMLRIRSCESGDGHGSYNYTAQNKYSSASGAWQIVDGTWNRFKGYRKARHAPRWVQDAKALLLYKDRGTQPWDASRDCWAR